MLHDKRDEVEQGKKHKATAQCARSIQDLGMCGNKISLCNAKRSRGRITGVTWRTQAKDLTTGRGRHTPIKHYRNSNLHNTNPV